MVSLQTPRDRRTGGAGTASIWDWDLDGPAEEMGSEEEDARVPRVSVQSIVGRLDEPSLKRCEEKASRRDVPLATSGTLKPK
jgi:hypothetical protein